MVIKINRKAIAYNIRKAEKIANGIPISIMVKGFYEWLFDLECVKQHKIYSQNIPNSVCYALKSAGLRHNGAVVADFDDFKECYYSCGIHEFYIPRNMSDDREGLGLKDIKRLANIIRKNYPDVKLYMMITSGCLNDRNPGLFLIQKEWRDWASDMFDGVSLGGSFYLSQCNLDELDFVTDIRIGEYALFGTIPFCYERELLGRNAITVESEVIATYPDRRQIVVRGGYSEIDTDRCTLLSGGLTFADTSSEYTIYNDPYLRYKVGDKVEVVPNYKSLVKLQYVAREYTK